jgi:hypothetical protein
MPSWQPYREPVRTTLLRTGAIAVALGAMLAARRGGIARWPAATLIALWPSLGGHFVELFFLNWLRPRLPIARGVQIAARLLVWFIGGIMLMFAMAATAQAIGELPPAQWPTWWRNCWIGGLAFIGVELIAHLFLQLRGRQSFYNGRG